MIRSVVTGCGGYLPDRVLTNAELAEMVDTSDEWIVARSGIRERHIAADGETTADLAVQACTRAMEAAGVGAADIDLIVLATATPDDTFPATATIVQDRLGIRQGAAFDIQAVCSGFLYGLATADNFLKAGQFRRALVVPRPSRASWTGPTAAPACCSAMAPAPSCWRRSRAPARRLIAAC